MYDAVRTVIRTRAHGRPRHSRTVGWRRAHAAPRRRRRRGAVRAANEFDDHRTKTASPLSAGTLTATARADVRSPGAGELIVEMSAHLATVHASEGCDSPTKAAKGARCSWRSSTCACGISTRRPPPPTSCRRRHRRRRRRGRGAARPAPAARADGDREAERRGARCPSRRRWRCRSGRRRRRRECSAARRRRRAPAAVGLTESISVCVRMYTQILIFYRHPIAIHSRISITSSAPPLRRRRRLSAARSSSSARAASAAACAALANASFSAFFASHAVTGGYAAQLEQLRDLRARAAASLSRSPTAA